MDTDIDLNRSTDNEVFDKYVENKVSLATTVYIKLDIGHAFNSDASILSTLP